MRITITQELFCLFQSFREIEPETKIKTEASPQDVIVGAVVVAVKCAFGMNFPIELAAIIAAFAFVGTFSCGGFNERLA